MKKIKLLCQCLLLIVLLVACNSNSEETSVVEKIDAVEETDIVDEYDFTSEHAGRGVHIYIHEKTGVQYIFVKEGYGAGITVLVDEDGKPILYEKELE